MRDLYEGKEVETFHLASIPALQPNTQACSTMDHATSRHEIHMTGPKAADHFSFGRRRCPQGSEAEILINRLFHLFHLFHLFQTAVNQQCCWYDVTRDCNERSKIQRRSIIMKDHDLIHQSIPRCKAATYRSSSPVSGESSLRNAHSTWIPGCVVLLPATTHPHLGHQASIARVSTQSRPKKISLEHLSLIQCASKADLKAGGSM